MFSKTTRALALVLTLTAVPSMLAAQSDDDANGAVQFDFSTPGARSLGLGGAFVGAADDATAAYANPAGLFQLSEPEVSIEGRQWSYSIPFAVRGRFSGPVTGIGVDTIDGVEFGRTSDELSGISFASFVYPKAKWAFALYYHQVANFESTFETEGVFLDGFGNRLFPVRSSYDLDISQIGAAVAFKWGKGSAGIGVSNYSFDLRSLTQRFAFFANGGPPAFDFPQNFQQQLGDGDEIGFSAGLHFEAGPKTRIGLVYRFGPEFDVGVTSTFGAPADMRPLGPVADAILDLPDVAALGISHKATKRLTVNADVTLVRYSELLGLEDEDQPFVILFTQDGTVEPEDFVIDDAVELHLGLEYVFDQIRAPIALRFGAWWDPDHRLRFEDTDEANNVIFFEGDDELHVTAGLGIVIGSRFQLDAAVDLSDNYDIYSLSTVVRF